MLSLNNGNIYRKPTEKIITRDTTQQVAYWIIPLQEVNLIIFDVTVNSPKHLVAKRK